MEREIKCTNCGSKEMIGNFLTVETNDQSGVHGYPTSTFICVKCGHVEIFLNEDRLQRSLERERKRIQLTVERETAKVECEKHLEQLKKREAELPEEKRAMEIKVNDRNRTVNAVAKSKQQLEWLKSELSRNGRQKEELEEKLRRIEREERGY